MNDEPDGYHTYLLRVGGRKYAATGNGSFAGEPTHR